MAHWKCSALSRALWESKDETERPAEYLDHLRAQLTKDHRRHAACLTDGRDPPARMHTAYSAYGMLGAAAQYIRRAGDSTLSWGVSRVDYAGTDHPRAAPPSCSLRDPAPQRSGGTQPAMRRMHVPVSVMHDGIIVWTIVSRSALRRARTEIAI